MQKSKCKIIECAAGAHHSFALLLLRFCLFLRLSLRPFLFLRDIQNLPPAIHTACLARAVTQKRRGAGGAPRNAALNKRVVGTAVSGMPPRMSHPYYHTLELYTVYGLKASKGQRDKTWNIIHGT